jgi:predicted transcriptional regulator
MPLLSQWVRQRPWLAAGLLGATSGLSGIAGGVVAAAGAIGAITLGGVSSKSKHQHEHPQRLRILSALEVNPGLCYRELQSVLNAANGTLRHHLDVLQARNSVIIVPVNGRTCYFTGAPSQVEELRGMKLGEQAAANALPIGLSLVQRLILEDIDKEGVPRSQAELARRIGRSRATIHSAVKVLRRRGILREDRVELMPHINMDMTWHGTVAVDYEWDDRRRD